MYSIENSLREQGFNFICGVDEAGRGPLAGPVCAAAVIFEKDVIINGINDSKKLSEKKREKLYDEIIEKALAYKIVMIDAQRIDEINILQATFEAMKSCVNNLPIKPDYVIIDGDKCPIDEIEAQAIIKGDGKSATIAAASILAKVTRDRYMVDMSKEYPQYLFEKHKGYGTKVHYQAIAENGICPLHRRTFLKKILGTQNEK